MPIYEYECERCQRVYEMYDTISNYEPMKDCTNCGEQMKRILSAPAVVYELGAAGLAAPVQYVDYERGKVWRAEPRKNRLKK